MLPSNFTTLTVQSCLDDHSEVIRQGYHLAVMSNSSQGHDDVMVFNHVLMVLVVVMCFLMSDKSPPRPSPPPPPPRCGAAAVRLAARAARQGGPVQPASVATTHAPFTA